MSTDNIDRERRRFLGHGTSLLGATVSGTMFPSLVSGCGNNANTSTKNKRGKVSKYLKYKDKLDKCFSAVIQDVMDSMNVRVQCMDPKIKPLIPSMKTWGEAVTIYLETVTEVPEKPFQMEMELLDDTIEGQIIVAQCNARELSAFWGGLLTNAAVGHKVAGIIIDGGARDYDEIVELNFPTFCKGLSPYDSLGRMDGKERDIPIECGGVMVCPGDLVYGDVDGVVVVPQEMVDEVIAKAWEKVQGESTVREELRSGASVVETFEKYGIL
ncbi:RraA family protein [Candidatus Latescibacterota bacterium]